MSRVPLLCITLAAAALAEDWTRFRGPAGSGVSEDTGFPSELSTTKTLAWRVPVRPGKASPVLTKDRVLLTGAEKGKLYTQCFDRKTGKLLWSSNLFPPVELGPVKLRGALRGLFVRRGCRWSALGRAIAIAKFSPAALA